MISTQRVLFSTLALVLALTASTFAVTTVYDSEADFLAATASDGYLEDFGGIGFGDPGNPLPFGPVNGYSYDIDAATGLFSGGGNMSTNSAFDPMTITFTGAPVMAVGGNFWLTDFDFLTEVGMLTVDLADGSSTSVSLTDALPSTFTGFVSDGPAFASITLTPVDPGDGINRWSTVDNLNIRETIPEPTSFGLLAMSLLGMLGLRRR